MTNRHHPDDVQLQAYLDETLTEPAVIAHIEGCDQCGARLLALDPATPNMRALWSELADMPSCTDHIMTRIRTMPQPEPIRDISAAYLIPIAVLLLGMIAFIQIPLDFLQMTPWYLMLVDALSSLSHLLNLSSILDVFYGNLYPATTYLNAVLIITVLAIALFIPLYLILKRRQHHV